MTTSMVLEGAPRKRSTTVNVTRLAATPRSTDSTRPTNTTESAQYAAQGAATRPPERSCCADSGIVSNRATRIAKHPCTLALAPLHLHPGHPALLAPWHLLYLTLLLEVCAVGRAVHGSSGHGCFG